MTPRLKTLVQPSERDLFVRSCDALAAQEPVCRVEPAWQRLPSPILLAHAGAGGIFYGNARECFEHSISNGFKILEIDVSLTSDGVPVLSHRFRPNFDIAFDATPTCAEFLATKICDRYTPMTLAQFFDTFADYDGYVCVDQTDQLMERGFDLIGWLVQNVSAAQRDRIIFQAYTFEDLARLQREHPFGAHHYCLGPEAWGGTAQEWRIAPLFRALRAADVTSVSFGDMPLDDHLRKLAKTCEEAGLRVWVANVNGLVRLRAWRSVGVTCFDTDFLLPGDPKLKEVE